MKWIPHVGAAILLALFSVKNRLGAADKINTSYISTSPGSSTVIWIAKGSLLARLPHGGWIIGPVSGLPSSPWKTNGLTSA
jgi:hypothetical protein